MRVLLVAAAAAVLALVACGSMGARPLDRAGTPSSGPAPPDPRCLSANQAGLLTCAEAIARASAEGGRGSAYPLDAKLGTYRYQQESEPVPAWIVTWHGVPEHVGSGAQYTGPAMCRITEDAVVIDAESGEFYVESLTSNLPGSPCPQT
jgi:hypothetical protein